MIQFNAARAFVNNVTEFFGRADGERSKCPRCKGTGLLAGRPFWHWDQPPASNKPCWFCEGVGVMPIVGLSGFMCGRSTPVFQTRDIKPRPRPPIKVQLCLGKYPGAKCNLTSYKPSNELSNLLYDPYHCPSWLNTFESITMLDGDSEDGSNGSIGMETADPMTMPREKPGKMRNAGMEVPFRTPKTPEYSRSPRQHRTNVKIRNFMRYPASPHYSHRPSVTPQNIYLQASPYRSAYSQSPSSMYANHTSKTNKKGESPSSANRSNIARRLNPRRTPLSPSLHVPTMQAAQSPTDQGTYLDPNETELGNPAKSGSPILRSPRGSRSPRRERNRIREEAEKEAVERAHKSQLLLATLSEEATTATSDSTLDGTGSASNTHSEVFGNSLGVETATPSRQMPWPRLAASSRRLSSDLSSMNQFLYGKVKEGLLRPPTFGKAF